jgi:scyllo-inositol 2-dehydrogenase (NAD+)
MTGAKRRIKVGLVGLGRLGRIYARDLATRIPETRLSAVADPDEAALAEVSATYDARPHRDPEALFQDSGVEAIVIASPTHTHAALTVAASGTGKPIFCEKPPALSLAETARMKTAVSRPGVFFQMGFMRRFDPGYAAAKRKVQEGLIGTPVVFKSSSRDPHRTTLEYANPKSSGGMIMDMGIHDFDLARFFMGEVKSVAAVGGTLAYPELKSVGDIDNAIVSLVFSDDRIGVVDLSRNGIYGYDISTELLGTEGTLRVGYIRETPLLVMTKNSVAHDTVPYFMERFAQAYTIQLQDFARNVIEGRPPTLTIDDGIAAITIALAAERARTSGKPVSPADVTA